MPRLDIHPQRLGKTLRLFLPPQHPHAHPPPQHPIRPHHSLSLRRQISLPNNLIQPPPLGRTPLDSHLSTRNSTFLRRHVLHFHHPFLTNLVNEITQR